MADLKVVPLHDGRPALNDIPGRLRLLADQIETAIYTAETVYVVLPQAGEFPKIFGFGNVEGDNSPITQLELMKHWLVANLVVRA